MATDYDTPRKTDEELHRGVSSRNSRQNVLMLNPAKSMLMKQRLLKISNFQVQIYLAKSLRFVLVPKQVDEFTCSRCFLVHHITQLAKGEGAKAVCKECN
jgi:hypothetical protein